MYIAVGCVAQNSYEYNLCGSREASKQQFLQGGSWVGACGWHGLMSMHLVGIHFIGYMNGYVPLAFPWTPALTLIILRCKDSLPQSFLHGGFVLVAWNI